MNKPKFETPDMTMENIDKIANLFPNCITETKDADGKLKKAINFDMLKQMLSKDIADGDEAYEFTWIGKKAAIVEANTPIRKTLRPVIEDEITPTGKDSEGNPYCSTGSVNWDTTQNLYIEGDNLEVLKLLQESYLNKVKMIYIDPPYNTGNDFIYRDDFTADSDQYQEKAGLFDEEGNRMFKNTDTNGRFHSDWCSMIYSRLLLARNLLSDDGVIFISIDDNEIENLKKICDEVFGENNFIATFPWRKRTAKSDVPFGVSQDYEWTVCYAKSDFFKASIEGNERKYFETPDFPGRPWRFHDMTTQRTASERPNSYFTMINPKTHERYPANPNATWRITSDTFDMYYKQNRIIFPGDYDFLTITKPVLRYWKEDDISKAGDDFGKIAVSTKYPDEIGMSQDGTKEITDLFSGKVFGYPKPISLIKFLTKISTSNLSLDTNNSPLILDFFSGSATTAHAVMQLNSEDQGNRKFICVQLPEKTDENSEAYKAGYKNICEIGEERIRRAGKKIKEETGADIDYGFRVFKVDSSNMQDVYYRPNEYSQKAMDLFADNIKTDRTAEDLLFQVMLDLGILLSSKVEKEKIANKHVLSVADGYLIACCDKDVTEEVVTEIA